MNKPDPGLLLHVNHCFLDDMRADEDLTADGPNSGSRRRYGVLRTYWRIPTQAGRFPDTQPMTLINSVSVRVCASSDRLSTTLPQPPSGTGLIANGCIITWNLPFAASPARWVPAHPPPWDGRTGSPRSR